MRPGRAESSRCDKVETQHAPNEKMMLTHSHARALDIAKDKMLDIAKVHTLFETILLVFTCPVLTFFCFHFFRSVCCVMHLRVCLRVLYVFSPVHCLSSLLWCVCVVACLLW